MLATVRIGAVHSVVFGGFAAASLATRIDDARPKVLVTADAGMRGGKVSPYKPLVDEAMRLAQHPPSRVIIVDRGLDPAFARHGRARSRLCDAGRGSTPDASVAMRMARILGAVVHPLHVGYDRASPRACSATPAATRWRWRRSMRDIFCVASRRDDVHHQRHRLGGRAFVHRLRAAAQRLDHDPVRRPADPARSVIWWQIVERAPGAHDVHARRRRSAC